MIRRILRVLYIWCDLEKAQVAAFKIPKESNKILRLIGKELEDRRKKFGILKNPKSHGF